MNIKNGLVSNRFTHLFVWNWKRVIMLSLHLQCVNEVIGTGIGQKKKRDKIMKIKNSFLVSGYSLRLRRNKPMRWNLFCLIELLFLWTKWLLFRYLMKNHLILVDYCMPTDDFFFSVLISFVMGWNELLFCRFNIILLAFMLATDSPTKWIRNVQKWDVIKTSMLALNANGYDQATGI